MNILNDPTVITAIVGSAVALVSLALNFIVSIRTRQLADFLEITKSTLEFKKQQVDELYGPLVALRRQNAQLFARLQKMFGSDFRLVKQSSKILKRTSISSIVKRLLENNEEMERLLLTKASLIKNDSFPESFSLFLGHCQVLKSAVNGQPLDDVSEADYYPEKFDEEIEKTYTELKKEINDILEKRSSLLGKERKKIRKIKTG